MELKKYKYIKNNRALPGYDDGKPSVDLTTSDAKQWLGGVSVTTGLPTTNDYTNQLKGKINEQLSNINNIKISAPSTIKQSFGSKLLGKAGAIATDAIGAYSSMSNAFNSPIKTVNDINNDSGTNESNVGGVSLTLQNQADAGQQMRELQAENNSNTMAAAGSGAKLGNTVGSLFGPVGGAIGSVAGGLIGGITGLFGGASRRRKMRERLRQMAVNTAQANSARMDTAMSTSMGNEWNEEHEDTSDDILYANNGKSAMRKYNNGKVWSPNGYGYGPTNSKVGLGESIVNFRTGKGTLVTDGIKGVDNQDSSVQPGDDNTIFGNVMNPYSGMLFSDQAAPLTAQLQQLNSIKPKSKGKQSSLSNFTAQVQQREIEKAKQQTLGQLRQLAQQQEEVHQTTGQGNYNNGKLPGYDADKNGMALTGTLGEITALGRKPTNPSMFSPYWGHYLNIKNIPDDERVQNLRPYDMPVEDVNIQPLYSPYWGSFLNKTNLSNYGILPYYEYSYPFTPNSHGFPGPKNIDAGKPIIEIGPHAKKHRSSTPDAAPLPSRDYTPDEHLSSYVIDRKFRREGSPDDSFPSKAQRDKPLTNSAYRPPYDESAERYEWPVIPKSTKPSFWDKLNTLLTRKKQLGDYHTVPSLATALAGFGQYNRANAQEVKGSDIYASNPYERMALQGMAQQRLNPYAYMRPMYDAERRGAYQINNSGAMTGGQRQASRVALALGSQQNMANMLRDVNEKNIGYKNAYYNTALNAGNQDAQRRQQANQFDYETYNKAHGAREQMRQMGIRNMLSALWQYDNNRFKRDMGNANLDLYNRKLSQDHQIALRQLQKGGSK